jgi:DNA primase
LYITEGELKALALYEHGYQAIGIPGVNSFRPSWMHMIKNQDITLIMDPDEPGLKAARELKNQFLLCKGLLINDLTKKFSKDIDEEFLDNPSLKLEDIW